MMSQTASRVAVMMAARCAALNQIAGLAVVMMDVQSAALNQPGARAAVMMAAQYEAYCRAGGGDDRSTRGVSWRSDGGIT